MKLYLKTMLLITLLLGVLSCGKKEETKEQPQTAETQTEQKQEENGKRIILATTTSTQDSGLLDYLLPEFTKDTGIEVSVVAKGTGEA